MLSELSGTSFLRIHCPLLLIIYDKRLKTIFNANSVMTDFEVVYKYFKKSSVLFHISDILVYALFCRK